MNMIKGIGTGVILEALHAAQEKIPVEVKSALGGFSWQERIHQIEATEDKLTIKFYSDGVDLKTKTAVESFIRETIASHWALLTENVTVYFERKDKSTQSAPAPRPQQAQQPKPSGDKVPSSRKGIPGVKNIIAVASGKGGVGKSTVSVNLAASLYAQGFKVGILDADIYGPSIPTMLNIHKDPEVNDKNKIIPPEKFGMKVMSFGFFVPEDSAVIWRGPMVMKALNQFFYDVDWGELDYLVIDLPPGTGDAQLTLVQSLPITGAVIVTTPQNVALLDCVKGIAMFQKTDVPIAGVVENMSTFVCTHCEKESHIFGQGGADRVSEKFNVPVLGHIPLVAEVREGGDSGHPIVTNGSHPLTARFAAIAEKVTRRLVEIQPKISPLLKN